MQPLAQGLGFVFYNALFWLLGVSILLSDSSALGAEATRVFDVYRLLKISIQMSPSDWKALRTQTKSDFDRSKEHGMKPKRYTYFKGDITIDGVTIPSIGIRKKGGFGSVVSTRPSLKIKFEEYEIGRAHV